MGICLPKYDGLPWFTPCLSNVAMNKKLWLEVLNGKIIYKGGIFPLPGLITLGRG